MPNSPASELKFRVPAEGVSADEELLAAVYEDLRRMAAAKMAREAPGQTLQPTALVHEAWLRLGGSNQPAWNSRGHFFGAAAEAMRRILVERARAREAKKRGGNVAHVELELVDIASPGSSEEVLNVSDALDLFAREHPKKAELVKLKFFAGIALKEAAVLLEISEPTAKRWWAFSKAWLFDAISTCEPHRALQSSI